ncbi:MAG: Xaa-Pro peptidase family protein [Anaerolineales bacterium]|jgi:Xaa-Pro aminopeptidase
MDEYNLQRLAGYLREQRISAALLSNPATLTWLTGYAPEIETGLSPFEGGPALSWWHEGALTLVVSDQEASAAQCHGVEVVPYLSYTFEQRLAGLQRQVQALGELLARNAHLTGRVGVEMGFLPAAIAAALRESLPHAEFRDLDGSFDVLRAVKSREEIGKVRSALKLCDHAQDYIRLNAVAGTSELELWGRVRGYMEAIAGTRLPIQADLVAGKRAANVGGPPSGYTIQDGDVLIFDVVPRVDGYWGDNAATYFIGEPAPELRKAYSLVWSALKRAIDAIRPGIKAGDLDQMMRLAIRDKGYQPYPHHSGHGVGTTYHEEPRIVPYSGLVLEPGMVLAVEPGIYLPGLGGVRLEEVVLLTADGCEILTKHLLDA